MNGDGLVSPSDGNVILCGHCPRQDDRTLDPELWRAQGAKHMFLTRYSVEALPISPFRACVS